MDGSLQESMVGFALNVQKQNNFSERRKNEFIQTEIM